MSRYNQYGNYYDRVGSQSHQPGGYRYQQSSTSTSASAFPSVATSSGYGSNYQYGNNTYGTQQYGTSAGQHTNANTNTSASHAAVALSSLSTQDYSHASSANRTDHYDNSAWYNAGSNVNTYGNNSMAVPNRSQSNNSPHPSSTFGRLSIPDQSQSTSNTFNASAYQGAQSSAGTSNRSYQTGYHQTQNQPQRYHSPLHAMQAQHQGHNKQGSRSSSHQPSPQLSQAVGTAQQNTSLQQTPPVEPSPTTVDPSQLYDNRAELERKACIETGKRRKLEAEQAAKRAEEERIEAEERKVEEEKQRAENEAKIKAQEQTRKKEQRKKAREEKKQNKSAATTLQQMATGSTESSTAPPADDEEGEMRAMFKKMREFNAKNPSMLAKLWEEERKSHATLQSPQAEKAPSQTPAPQEVPSATPASGSKAAAISAQETKSTSPKSSNVASAASQKAAQAPATRQPQPASSPANTSLWPPHKKGSLAEATSNWLESMPQNAGKQVNPAIVLNILNSNPSYVQLCESLEGFGLKFDRSMLARQLLKAVPDGVKTQPTLNTPTPTGNGTAAQTAGSSASSPSAPKEKSTPKKDGATPAADNNFRTVDYEAPLSLTEAAKEVNSRGATYAQPPAVHGGPAQQSQNSPYFSQSQTLTNGSRPPSQSQPPGPDVKLEAKPEEPPRPPADKEEAARKRTFGDLVDLTAEESDEEPPPKKIAQPPTVPSNDVNNQQRPYLQQPTSFNQYMTKPDQGNIQIPLPPPGHMAVQTYNLGQQQSHGAPQPQQQVPPTPQPPPIPTGPSGEQQQQARMKGKMLVEPIMRDRVARKSKYDSKTIARDVLLATGRHPDMRGLNAHLVTMQKLLGQHGGEFDSEGRSNRSDLSTIRWDIIDPDEPKEADEVKKTKTASKTEAVAVNGEDAESEKDDAGALAPKRQVRVGSTTVGYEVPEGRTESKKPRRGRPPKYPRVRQSMPKNGSLTNNLGTPTQTSRPATPSSASTTNTAMASGTSVGYGAFAQIGPDGAKKRGRPFGWRKNIHSREAQGLLPKSAPKALPGRPKLAPPAAKEERVQQPHYQVYKCEWAGCKSELHNLDTLKKHLVKVHGTQNKDFKYECWWKGCKSGAAGETASFEGIESWVKHVDTEHFQPIAWKLGDGPKAGIASDTWHESETTPSYLCDEYGRSVTPVISPTPPPSGELSASQTATEEQHQSSMPTTASPPVKRVGRPPKDGINKAEKDFSAPLTKLEEHIRVVGPTMERGGCVLANEERRKGFLDDEDFEDEVYGSEHDPSDDGE